MILRPGLEVYTVTSRSGRRRMRQCDQGGLVLDVSRTDFEGHKRWMRALRQSILTDLETLYGNS